MSIEVQRNMKGSLKSFDKASYDAYDSKGKIAMLEFLNRKLKNLKSIENPNQYGIDLLTLNEFDKVVGCWEIEVRHGNWKGDVKFPFSEINCIERKDYQWRKDDSFIRKIPYSLANNYKVTYVQMNRECNRIVMIDGDTILKYPLRPWANRKADNEYVRQVPIDKTIQVRISNIE